MTEEELLKLYKSCLKKNGDLDDEKYEEAIHAVGGERFFSIWQDYHHEACHPEENMIEYMKKYGFIVCEDPEYEGGRYETTGWVVFPPKG